MAVDAFKQFMGTRRREVLLRGETDELLFSEERFSSIVALIETQDATTGMALVDLMKALHTKGDADDVASVGANLLRDDPRALEAFGKLVGKTSVELLRIKRKKAEPRYRPAGERHVWRVEGDENLGRYYRTDNIMRVEAWAMKNGRKVYRSTRLVGDQRGTFVETSDLPETTETPDVEGLDPTLPGCNIPAIKDAIETKELTDTISDDWGARFGAVVWARDKTNEPAWPAVVLDPRHIGSDLRKRALKLIGTKHVVRFLGLPEAKSLGFLPPGSLHDWDNQPENSKNTKTLKNKAQQNYLNGIAEAEKLQRPPPQLGATITVKWEGDPTTYTCTVCKDPEEEGALAVKSDMFGKDEPDLVPFDPDEDDWALITTTTEGA